MYYTTIVVLIVLGIVCIFGLGILLIRGAGDWTGARREEEQIAEMRRKEQ